MRFRWRFQTDYFFKKMHSLSIKLIPLGEPPLSVTRPVERKLTEEPQVFKKRHLEKIRLQV